jgi:hypothetical protein
MARGRATRGTPRRDSAVGGKARKWNRRCTPMHADARRCTPMHADGSESGMAVHGRHRSSRSWRAAPERWPLSHRCPSMCIGGSRFLRSRQPHEAFADAGRHRKQNPMHLYRPPPRPFPCGRAQAAPVSSADAKTPCTCTDQRQRLASPATVPSRTQPAEQKPHAPIRRATADDRPSPRAPWRQHPMPSGTAQRCLGRPGDYRTTSDKTPMHQFGAPPRTTGRARALRSGNTPCQAVQPSGVAAGRASNAP